MSTDAQARAQSLYDNGYYRDAEAAVLEMLAIDATRLDAYLLLAQIEYSLGNTNREREAVERAVAFGENDVRRLRRLASLHAQEGDFAASAAVYERAIQCAPGDVSLYEGLSKVLFAQQDLSRLAALVEELEAQLPDEGFTYLLKGHLEKAHGDTRAACECYVRALALKPTCGEALFGIVDLGIPVGDDLKEQAAAMVSRDTLPIADAINADFAYARILDREGQYGEAFSYFQRANTAACNALADRGIVYDARRVEERTEQTVMDYPARVFETPLDPLPIDLVPVFVVGLPRSGTTLIEQILASHRDVEAGGELIFARECEQRLRQQRRAAGREGPIDPTDDQDVGFLEEARERYLDALFERDLDGPWVVDKMPANFEILGFIRLLFPNAPIVHTVRDARATCFSLYIANFGAHEPYYHSLEHLVSYYAQYQRLMTHWRNVAGDPFVEIHYESLVQDPDSGIPTLLRNVGLPPDPACLRFYEHDRPVLTASHAQVRQPVYTSALDHWRNYEPWLAALKDL